MFSIKRSRKTAYFIVLFLFCLNLLAWADVYYLSQPKHLKVVFFDVGQGDSIFISTPKSQKILIDGGPSPALAAEKLAKQMPFYDNNLDMVVLTHPDQDHLLGLFDILKRYKVKTILWSGVAVNNAEYQEWEKAMKNEGADIKIARAGEKIILQKNPDILIDVLNPTVNGNTDVGKDINDTSVVMRLSFLNNSFLFTGDISSSQEAVLLADNQNLKSDVLKVSHHGSKEASSPDFLSAVGPKTAVIEVGRDNSYGHPSSEVLENLKKSGIDVMRTDQNGDIKISSDGNSLKIDKDKN